MATRQGAQNSVAMDAVPVDATPVVINGGLVANNVGKRNAISSVILGWEVYAPPSVNLLVAWGGAFTGTPPAYTFNPGATDMVQNAGTANATRVLAGQSVTFAGDGQLWAVRETGAGAVNVNCRAFF